MRVKRLPTILALHLKRFKYVEQYNRHIKVITMCNFSWYKPSCHRFHTVWSSPWSSGCSTPRTTPSTPTGCTTWWLWSFTAAPDPTGGLTLEQRDQLVTSLFFRGHYISIVKSHGFWLIFDDDIVDKIDPATIEDFYGLTADVQKSSETGYILFYESRDPQ